MLREKNEGGTSRMGGMKGVEMIGKKMFPCRKFSIRRCSPEVHNVLCRDPQVLSAWQENENITATSGGSKA